MTDPISVTVAYDVTHANLAHAPTGHQLCGYTTGSGGIAWTAADWTAHPHAVRICQDAAATDTTADVLDVERGAATNTEAAAWYQQAQHSYTAATRPGQRRPAIYTSASNVTPLVNALIADGVTGGPHLWIANWNLTETQAVADVLAAAGPYPIIGIQFHSFQFYDADIFSASWLTTVSAPAGPTRHTADGKASLAGVCERHGKPLADAIWLTCVKKTSGLGPLQHRYFGGGNMKDVMPAGMTYWLP